MIRARQAHDDVAAAGVGTPRKNNYPADRAAGDAVIAAYPGIVVARFFDGLDMAEPGLVPVQEWRPRSGADAGAGSAMQGGVGRKR